MNKLIGDALEISKNFNFFETQNYRSQNFMNVCCLRGVFRMLSNIYDVVFNTEIIKGFLALKYSCTKRLHHRCLTRFYTQFSSTGVLKNNFSLRFHKLLKKQPNRVFIFVNFSYKRTLPRVFS